MDEFELEIKNDFLREAIMNLEEVESFFLALETSQDPTQILEKIFRLAHNLKGGSLAVGFEQVGEFTHLLEIEPTQSRDLKVVFRIEAFVSAGAFDD